MNDFDSFPHITYSEITSLFWDTFPYRVTILYPYQYPSFGGGYDYFSMPLVIKTKMHDDFMGTVKEYLKSRKEFRGKLQKHCPDDTTLWKTSIFGSSSKMHYYFINKEDAYNFIRNNNKYVISAVRPSNDAFVAVLNKKSIYNYKKVLKDSLYWNKYKYCIEFRCLYGQDVDDLDEHITKIAFLGKKNSKRYYYPFSSKRRLYLKNEKDILLILLHAKEKIEKIHEVHLKEKIK